VLKREHFLLLSISLDRMWSNREAASRILHEQGYAREHIELQLAHAPRNAVSAAYNHALHLKGRAKMMQDWARFLEHTQRGGKLLPFRGSAA
jgi:hypothetical protein